MTFAVHLLLEGAVSRQNSGLSGNGQTSTSFMIGDGDLLFRRLLPPRGLVMRALSSLRSMLTSLPVIRLRPLCKMGFPEA